MLSENKLSLQPAEQKAWEAVKQEGRSWIPANSPRDDTSGEGHCNKARSAQFRISVTASKHSASISHASQLACTHRGAPKQHRLTGKFLLSPLAVHQAGNRKDSFKDLEVKMPL